MKQIINLTQHNATAEQNEAGVFSNAAIAAVAALTNFVGMPTKEQIVLTAKEVAEKLSQLVQSWAFSPEEVDRERNEGGMPNEESGLNYYTTCLTPWKVMIGGAPWFMSSLEKELEAKGFKPVYAFSERVSVEQKQEDGSVKKINIFRHAGFIE